VQVKIRLQRLGSKKRPFYRIIAASSTKKRDGRFLDILGLYHPISAPESQIRLDDEKVKKWLDQGAEPSDTVKNILTKKGMWKNFAESRETKRVQKVKKANQSRKSKKSGAQASTGA